MRRGSASRRFRYAAAFALVDLDEAEELLRRSWLLSGGRFAPSLTMTMPTDEPSQIGFATYGGGSA